LRGKRWFTIKPLSGSDHDPDLASLSTGAYYSTNDAIDAHKGRLTPEAETRIREAWAAREPIILDLTEDYAPVG